MVGTGFRQDGWLDFNLSYLLFFLFIAASLLLVLDPFYTGFGAFRVTRDLGPIRYFGFVIGVGAAFLSYVGLALRPLSQKPPYAKSLRNSLPALLFASVVVSGSLYARMHLGVKETFLQLGIAVFGFPLAMILFWAVQDGLKLAHRYMQLLLLTVPYMFAWIVIKRLEGGQAFHTEIFLTVPLAVYFYLCVRRRWLAWSIVLITVVLGIVSQKNTGYLVTLAVLAHLFILHFVSRFKNFELTRRVVFICAVVLLLLCLSAVLTFLLINRIEYLPSGSVLVRDHTYREAWLRFIDSPLVGNGFTHTALIFLQGFTVLGKNHVISHSDLLDILSHGGLLTFSLLSFVLLRPFVRARMALRRNPTTKVRSLTHGLGSIAGCGILVAAFNSPLFTFQVAILFWFSLGLLSAITDASLIAHASGNARVAGATGNDGCHISPTIRGSKVRP